MLPLTFHLERSTPSVWPAALLATVVHTTQALAQYSSMADTDVRGKFSPLQRAIYETDQLGLNLRDSMRTVTQRVGFFVGQERYLRERQKIEQLIAQYGPPVGESPVSAQPIEATHQIGTP